MRQVKSLIILSLFSFAMLSQTAAGVPQMIHYQGYLTNASGQPVNGAVPLTFSLYENQQTETPLWSETHAAVQVSNGIYCVTLGRVGPSGNPLNSEASGLALPPAMGKAAPLEEVVAVAGQGAVRMFPMTAVGSPTTQPAGPGEAGDAAGAEGVAAAAHRTAFIYTISPQRQITILGTAFCSVGRVVLGVRADFLLEIRGQTGYPGRRLTSTSESVRSVPPIKRAG